MHLSVIIPFYNEEKIIENNILQIYNYLKPKLEFEIIIINDKGQNVEALTKLNKEIKELYLIENDKNYGKGYSIRKGFKSSCGEIILISDADLSTPIEEFDKLYDYYKKNESIVIGSRNTNESKVLIIQPIYRIIVGKVYNLLIKKILKLNFNDTQCGFKLFKREILKNLINKTKSNRFGLDIELIYFATKENYNIEEVGVKWKNQPNSSVLIFRDSILMFIEIIKLSLK